MMGATIANVLVARRRVKGADVLTRTSTDPSPRISAAGFRISARGDAESRDPLPAWHRAAV